MNLSSKTFTYEAWKALSAPAQMQQEQRERNVVVSGWPLTEDISFNEEGLRKVAGTQSRQISINGKASFINPPYLLHVCCVDYSIKPFQQKLWANGR